MLISFSLFVWIKLVVKVIYKIKMFPIQFNFFLFLLLLLFLFARWKFFLSFVFRFDSLFFLLVAFGFRIILFFFSLSKVICQEILRFYSFVFLPECRNSNLSYNLIKLFDYIFHRLDWNCDWENSSN